MNQITKELARDLASRGYQSPPWFCRTFLTDWFPSPMPWPHLGVLAVLTGRADFLLDDATYESEICSLPKNFVLRKLEQNFVYHEDPSDDESPLNPIFRFDDHVHMYLGKYTQLRLPRGFSKTTLCNACVIMDTVYKERKFPVYISETHDHAQMQLGNVKRELESNTKLISVFGLLQPERMDPEKWTSDFIETIDGTSIVSRGRGGQVRGLNNRGHRPDKIICDDVEDKESVRTATQREKVRTWFYGDVTPALPALDDKATIVVLGTLLDSDSLLIHLQRDPEWVCVVLGALDRDNEPIWPEMMDERKLAAKRRSYQVVGQLPTFFLEYFNTVRDEESAKFKSHYIIYEQPSGDLLRSLIIDPAISTEPGADFCAFTVQGMSDKGLVYVLETAGRVGMSPREQVDTYFDLYARFRPEKCGVEAIAYQAALVHLLKEEMFRKGVYFEIETITHSNKTKKDERILGILQPRYAAGFMRHARRFPELESQLLDFPNGKKDFPDALSMGIALLDPFAAQAADPEKDLAADELPPLEEVYNGEDWRDAI